MDINKYGNTDIIVQFVIFNWYEDIFYYCLPNKCLLTNTDILKHCIVNLVAI